MRNETNLTVLQLTAPAEVGGLETVVLDLSAGLAARGVRTVLGTVLDEPATEPGLAERAQAAGVEVTRLVVPRRAYLMEYRNIARLMEELSPDLVHTHGYRADILGGVAARRAGIPWCSTAHGFIGGTRKARVYEWLQERALRRATRVVAVSRQIRERLAGAGVSAGRLVLLQNGWLPKTMLSRSEARRLLGIPENQVTIGWVGRLTREKGADILIQALATVRDQCWEASIIGDGRDRRALEDLARSMEVEHRVRWHGALPGAARLYPAFDLWVLSSRTEGTPMALFEAMEAEVPVVATDVGGVADVVSASEALLVRSGRPELLGAALRAALADPAAAAQRARAAHQRLHRDFAHGAWLDAHLALYQAALAIE